MFEKYFVSRTAYDNDVRALRERNSELTKELRELGKEKAAAQQETALVKSQTGGLDREIKKLRKQLKKANPVEFQLKDYVDPIPTKEEERRQYMAQVAGMFHGGLRDKLNYMHTQFKNQTGLFPLTERETDFFRSCINVVGLLLDWGEECAAEHNAYIAQANNKAETDAFAESGDDVQESVETIKSKLNE